MKRVLTWSFVIAALAPLNLASAGCGPLGLCCKTCRTGKACGDACIARGSSCHRPPGCACNG